LWQTFSLGEKTGAGIVVRDATTGAIKTVMLHRANSPCTLTGYRTDGSAYCVDPEISFTPEDQVSWPGQTSAGISALPEVSNAITQCWPINRVNVVGLTLAINQGATAPTGCTDAHWSGFLMGTDAVWGQKHFLQTRVGAPDWKSSPVTEVDEYDVEPSGAPNALGQQAVTMTRARTWNPQDASMGNYRDIAWRARGTKIDWSGPLTKDPSDWLRSPNNTQDKCLHYVVSDADIYVVGATGEHWYNLAPVT